MGGIFGRSGRTGGEPPAVLAILFGVLPVVGMLAPLALAPLLAVAAVLGIARLGPRAAWRRMRTRPIPLQGYVLLLLFAWGGLTAIWAPSPAFAALTIARALGCAVAAWVLVITLPDGALTPKTTRYLAIGLVWAAIVLLVVETAERRLLGTGSPLAGKAIRLVTHMDRGTTVCVLLLWPVLLDLWARGQRLSGLFVLSIVAAACGLSHDAASKVGLLLGGGALLLAARAPRLTAWLTGGAVAIAVLAAPLAAQFIPDPEESIHWHWLMPTAHHRLTIWRFAGAEILHAPVFGAGLEASRAIGAGKHVVVTDDAGDVRDEEVMPLHPHDAPLQLWLELGGIGAVLAAVLLLALVPPLAAAGGAGAAMLAAGFFFASVSYGLWQSWWQAALWLAFSLWYGLSPSASVLPHKFVK